ncbi:RNA-binding cell elongation regulator Jag/EloR [Enterococcus pallens]|uniref:RNA-binding protein KhpB n=1 Tax=Enterococcus pallens ATCC BAA-351 TaxID=1158607 RepID=R2Q7I3_9ENTE|nr:RNA-binding cell elongation regulator Jag/EloR [Enterococcus pallens]EOH91258.1 RNA-binding protein [Enterococcus pallens ATCC BAA-351]EOU11374.1 RNA-binding protein [Enterococcus pallens ATCC BAA-351]OJG76997.1 RNA-binding protein [Enterococcus pallens]
MPVYEGATIDEAIKHGLDVLGLTKDDVEIDILDEGKKGFLGIGKKNAQVSMEPTVSEEINEAVEEAVQEVVTEAIVEEKAAEVQLSDDGTELDNEEALKQLAIYLTNVTKEMGVPALVKIDRGSNGLTTLNLETNKQGMLIGKHGKILNALQYLAQVFVHRVAKNKLSVVVNVGNYRQKREEVLVRLAKRTAEKVKDTGRPVFLEPMPAFERKMIHSALSHDEYIKTHSEGEEPYRYLVVEPAKKYF